MQTGLVISFIRTPVHAQRMPQCKKTQRNLYSTDWRWGFAWGIMQVLAFVLGVTQVLAFLDTNMLVFPTLKICMGGLSQRDSFHVTVEYRL